MVVLLGMLATLVVGWFGWERHRFVGPPTVLMNAENSMVSDDPTDASRAFPSLVIDDNRT